MTAMAQTQTLTTAQARAHDGETATVCGVIASEHVVARSRGKPTFIDLDSEIRRYDFEQFARSGSQESARPLTITPRKGQPGCTDAPEGKGSQIILSLNVLAIALPGLNGQGSWVVDRVG
jgi:hypothetical protein